ncbi:MAG TPA: hypothetical protein VGM10_30605 [Actinocrinis sp.]|jgi:hypothetical protein
MNIPGSANHAARSLPDAAWTPARRPHRRSHRLLRLRRALFVAVAYDFKRPPAYGRRPERRLNGSTPR